MKRLRPLIGVCLLALGLAPPPASAQAPERPAADATPADSTPNAVARQRVGQVIVPEKSPILSSGAAAVRPVRPESNPLTPEVKDRVQSFDKYRNEYLKKQEELRKRTLGTTDQDREKIRQQFQEFRERWREQSVATREELRERQKELLERLPSHRELLEDAREQSRDTIRDLRERRGVDK